MANKKNPDGGNMRSALTELFEVAAEETRYIEKFFESCDIPSHDYFALPILIRRAHIAMNFAQRYKK